MASRPILLTGYDAKRCARRIHNEWDPTIEKVQWEVPSELQMRFDTGNAFEATVMDELKQALDPGRWIDLSEVRGKQATIGATVAALEAGTEVVMGGWLPDDVDGGRTGRPDLLLRVGDSAYVPGDVKGHQATTRSARGVLTYSTPADPATKLTATGRRATTTARLDDHLQLAHYWRMLEVLGRTSGRPTGFIIGTDDFSELSPGIHALTWLELDTPLFETYSRSRTKVKRTAMERYDHEQGFRVRVAAAAAAQEPALVAPIFIDECDSCPWYEHCLSISSPDTASAQITSGRLSIREWSSLAGAGVVTVEQLADLDCEDAEFQASYLPEVTHVKDPLGRLRIAVRRAGMICRGTTIERETPGPIAIPRADVEIDFDIEWDPDNRVYLWGALVNATGAEPEYAAFTSWDPLDAAASTTLATTFADWLRGQIAHAEAAQQTLLVYHYSAAEPTYLKRALGEDAVADLLTSFVDLLPIVREHYFGLHGLGIKKVAPAFGFEWRDDDPGGLQSQLWLIEARGDADSAVRLAAQQRILAYNEDDVRATAAVRHGLSQQRTSR